MVVGILRKSSCSFKDSFHPFLGLSQTHMREIILANAHNCACLYLGCIQVWNGKGSVLVPFYFEIFFKFKVNINNKGNVQKSSDQLSCGHDSLATPN